MKAARSDFLDTNVLIYAFTTDPRAIVAQSLLESGCSLSIQAVTKFTSVARRELGLTWPEIRDAIAAIRTLCPTIHPIDIETHTEALRIAERYMVSFFDSLMIAAALRAESVTLWSEDMRHGLIIDETLRSANPFAA